MRESALINVHSGDFLHVFATDEKFLHDFMAPITQIGDIRHAYQSPHSHTIVANAQDTVISDYKHLLHVRNWVCVGASK